MILVVVCSIACVSAAPAPDPKAPLVGAVKEPTKADESDLATDETHFFKFYRGFYGYPYPVAYGYPYAYAYPSVAITKAVVPAVAVAPAAVEVAAVPVVSKHVGVNVVVG